jgi:hypothetical protein
MLFKSVMAIRAAQKKVLRAAAAATPEIEAALKGQVFIMYVLSNPH